MNKPFEVFTDYIISLSGTDVTKNYIGSIWWSLPDQTNYIVGTSVNGKMNGGYLGKFDHTFSVYDHNGQLSDGFGLGGILSSVPTPFILFTRDTLLQMTFDPQFGNMNIKERSDYAFNLWDNLPENERIIYTKRHEELRDETVKLDNMPRNQLIK